MAFIKRLILLLLAVLIASAVPVQEDDSMDIDDPEDKVEYRLPTHVVPVHYDIKLTPYLIPQNFTFDGEVIIFLQIMNETTNLTLHSKDLVIDHNQTILRIEDNIDAFVPSRFQSDNETEMITFYFEEVLKPNRYMLYLKFTGVFSERRIGFYRTYYTNDDDEKVWLAVANFEPTGARQAFPCMDEPALKSTFSISIKHQSNYTALSNMPMLEQSELDEIDGKLWTRFQATPLMSTYLVSFLISDFVNVSSPDGTINVWCQRNALPRAEFPRDFAEKAAAELERYTNSTSGVPKVDHVAIPNLYPGAVENWGLIIYKESSFLYEENSSVTDKEHTAMQIAHELAHQWFGNLVSLPWWTHLWLKEGLASYFQYYITNKIYPDWHVMDVFVPRVMHVTLDSLLERIVAIDHAVDSPTDISSMYNGITYGKGPSIFRMLSHCLTEEVFHTGLIYYLQRHKYGIATPNDLSKALQDALDESDVPHGQFKVQEMLKSWTNQKGYPLVRVHRDYESGEVTVTQEFYDRKLNRDSNATDDEIDKNKWWIPINFVTNSNLDFSSTLPSHWLKPEDGNLTIGKVDVDDWIIVNAQQTGYYRVEYDALNWKKIAEYLNTKNYTNIHVLNRCQILFDAFELLQTRRLDVRTFLDIMKYLTRETEYVPWISAFAILKRVDILVYTDTRNQHLKPFIWSLMDTLIESVGFEERPNDDSLTRFKRDKLLSGACENYHPKCLRFVHEKLVAHLEDPDTNTLPSQSDIWTFCYGLRIANESIWYKVLEMSMNNTDLLLGALACTNNRTILQHYLNMTITKESVFSPIYISAIISSVTYAHPEYVDTVLEFVTHNWKEIAPKIKNPDAILNAISGQILTFEQLEKLREFLKLIQIPEPGILSIVEKGIPIIQFYMDEVQHWLEEQNQTSWVTEVEQMTI